MFNVFFCSSSLWDMILILILIVIQIFLSCYCTHIINLKEKNILIIIIIINYIKYNYHYHYLYIYICMYILSFNRCVYPKKLKKQSRKFKWRDMWPSMVTHARNLCSAFNPSKVHTHKPWTHTHKPWTHTPSSGQPFMVRRPGSSWGFGVLLKGTSVVLLKVDPPPPPPQFLPATIRPRFPLKSYQI